MRSPSSAALRTLPQLKAFQYHPLSASIGSIRLLELQSTVNNRIHCNLREFSLQDAPAFNALSYTWGSSLAPFSAASTAYERAINKRQLGVKATSNDASVESGRISSGQDLQEDHKRTVSIACNGMSLSITANLRDAMNMLRRNLGANIFANTPYVWIDAICIDQNNIDERNAQVSLMSEIFQKAEGVVIWLGPEDEFTPDALKVFKTIGTLPYDAGESVADYTSFYDGSACALYGKLAIPSLTYHNWLGLLAFVKRPWFERAWIVQELALAKTATIVCGSTVIPWKWVSRTLTFLRNSRWYHHLTTSKLRHITELRKDPGIYRKLLKSNSAITMAPMYLNSTRENVIAARNSRGSPSPRKGPGLRMLMETHRFTRTTDPRDKVYAFLGLADPNFMPFSPAGESITPDYSLSAQELYAKATRVFIMARSNLSILCNVQDSSHTKTIGLPSWVPDYNVELHPYSMLYRGIPYFKAHGDFGPGWEPDLASMRKGLLPVEGFRVDTVEALAMLHNEGHNSAESWSSIVKVASGLHDRYLITMQGFQPSRVEVLWRTLMTNIYRRKSPAPPKCGEKFIDYILNLQIRHSLNPWSTDTEFQPHQSHLSDLDVPQWHALLAAEPEDSMYGLALYEQRFSQVVSRMFKGEYKSVGLSQFQHELDYASGSVRRLFRTQKKLLGTGARSIRVGDEVWVLRTAPVPLVLRKLENGNYRLVGEAYVHGLMYGKATRMGLEKEGIVLE